MMNYLSIILTLEQGEENKILNMIALPLALKKNPTHRNKSDKRRARLLQRIQRIQKRCEEKLRKTCINGKACHS